MDILTTIGMIILALIAFPIALFVVIACLVLGFLILMFVIGCVSQVVNEIKGLFNRY